MPGFALLELALALENLAHASDGGRARRETRISRSFSRARLCVRSALIRRVIRWWLVPQVRWKRGTELPRAVWPRSTHITTGSQRIPNFLK